MLLKQGMNGPEVRELQKSLKALGKDAGAIDGDFGPKTKAAVLDFQDDYETLTIDGIAGQQTLGAIEQALQLGEPEPHQPWQPQAAGEGLICPGDVWDAFNELVATIINLPVKYGPGRGLFVDGQWVVTYGPGKLDYKSWSSKIGKTYPSFHCSSFTNFFLGWVARRNAKYTHSGNIPSLFKMCESDSSLHDNNGMAKWRGYNNVCERFLSDGSSRGRSGIGDNRVVDLQEIYDRRAELPTFFVWGQSTKSGTKWKWWHHTGLFVVRHDVAGSPIFRLAADGYKGSSGYSATQMKYSRVTDDYIKKDVGKHVYRGYAIHPVEDGIIAPVVIED